MNTDCHLEEDGEFEDPGSFLPLETGSLATPAHLIEDTDTKQELGGVCSAEEETSAESASEEIVSKPQDPMPKLEGFFAAKNKPLNKEKRLVTYTVIV